MIPERITTTRGAPTSETVRVKKPAKRHIGAIVTGGAGHFFVDIGRSKPTMISTTRTVRSTLLCLQDLSLFTIARALKKIQSRHPAQKQDRLHLLGRARCAGDVRDKRVDAHGITRELIPFFKNQYDSMADRRLPWEQAVVTLSGWPQVLDCGSRLWTTLLTSQTYV